MTLIEDIPLPEMPEPPTLRTDLAALLATVGLDLTEQTTMYQPGAGVTRWEAIHRGHSKVVVEYWSLRMEPETRWYVQIITGGALVELREGVTLARAVDACVLAGLLPAEVRGRHWPSPAEDVAVEIMDRVEQIKPIPGSLLEAAHDFAKSHPGGLLPAEVREAAR